jgi:hypothetical protein
VYSRACECEGEGEGGGEGDNMGRGYQDEALIDSGKYGAIGWWNLVFLRIE